MSMDRALIESFLEGVAKTLWAALSEPHTVEQLCELVAANYSGADPAAVESDVLSFIDQLRVQELVEVSAAD